MYILTDTEGFADGCIETEGEYDGSDDVEGFDEVVGEPGGAEDFVGWLESVGYAEYKKISKNKSDMFKKCDIPQYSQIRKAQWRYLVCRKAVLKVC